MNKKALKEYRVWQGMKSRCYSPSQTKGYYKEDNIQVCERWRNSFENFIEDMGMMPDENYSIERIDYTKDYCPENCKWILQKEQPKNRRNVLIYTYDGKSMILKDWARFFGINYSTLHKKIKKGIPFEQAIIKDPCKRLVEINGEKKTVSEWCEFYNLNKGDVYSRIHRGWSKEDALLKNQQDIVQR